MMSDHYLIIYRPPRPTFPADASAEEAAVIERHFAYLQRLLADGVLVMAGRREDAEFGVAVIRAESEAAAREITKADPSVSEGVFTGEVHVFRLALLADGGDR
jgi:uncharacterized protein YciI